MTADSVNTACQVLHGTIIALLTDGYETSDVIVALAKVTAVTATMNSIDGAEETVVENIAEYMREAAKQVKASRELMALKAAVGGSAVN